MPGPIVPRPAPTPRAMALIDLAISAWPVAAAIRECTNAPCCGSVGLGDRAAEVDGCEGGEDERLKCCDQDDLEQEEHHRHGQRDGAKGGKSEQDHETAAHEQDQQVSG